MVFLFCVGGITGQGIQPDTSRINPGARRSELEAGDDRGRTAAHPRNQGTPLGH